MAANDAVSMNVAENRQNVPMAIQENRAAVPMTVAEGGGAGGLNRKADKVTGAAAGNLAGLDSTGNLTDSGKAPGDFLEAPATAGSEGQVLTADGEGGASWQDPTGGDPTEIIDDTAGDGDTDKVWSADKSHELLTEITQAQEDVSDLQKNKAPVIIDSAEGNPIVLTDGADGLPIEGMKIHFSPVQSGTGDPSPENVRPISGWQGLTAWRTGKNLFNPQSTESYWVPVSGAYGPAANAKSITLKAFAGETYTMSSSNERTTTNIICIAYYDKNDNRLSRNIPASAGKYVTATAPANTVKMIACCFTYSEAGNVQLEKSDAPSPYTEYTGQSYPVTFPDGQTVYGGTLDATTGVLTVDRAMVDLGTLSPWYKISTQSQHWRFWTYLNTAKVNGTLLSSDYVQITPGKQYQGAEGVATQTSWDNVLLMVSDERYEEVNTFTSAMSGVQLAYELATPYEIQLDPITVQTLIGDNTIWSDANGTIELDYRADTKLFIAKNKQDIRTVIAPIEDGATASQAYSAGKFFFHDGHFCKAKTSIASGAAFTLNTNYEVTTIADELFALN